MSPFTIWNVSLAAGAVQSRLSRYVRGIGTLLDVNIKQRAFRAARPNSRSSERTGAFSLKGGKDPIGSAFERAIVRDEQAL
ncbi:MAG: hypothetical protein IPK58_23705 [Acidobacteria bacterium]|nr:hypothetical protein [Acidobacteriota bacterium]